MPTYIVVTKPGLLSETRKNEIAACITQAHTKATGAANYFVQVIIDDAPHYRRYLGGQPSDGHIWINGSIRGGRTKEQRQGLMLDIMKGVSRISGVDESHVWIYLNNLEPSDMVEFGKVLPEPGREKEWFDALPPDLQAYLSRLGISKDNFTL